MATLPQAIAAVPSIFSACTPKEDVLKGAMADAEFAADLAQVLRGNAPAQYADPARFFSNTYPTRGLKNLLSNVCGRLSNGQGVASIFRLDTSYGGGKTHGLIALVHAVRSGRTISNIAEFVAPALLPQGNVRIAAYDGENADPSNGRKMDSGILAYTPWGELAEERLKEIKARRPGEVVDDGLKFSTTTGYLSVIKQHLRPTWGTVQLTDIKPLAVQEWLKQIDLSRKTRQNIKAVFHRMMELAMLWGLMPAQRNPLSLVEIKGGSSRPRRKKMILTPEQFQQICEKLDEPFRTMVVIAMCLGLRVSEILALKWSDFDFEEGTLMITRGTVHARIGRVKTEYSEDEMPLHPAFAEILLAWQAGCPASQEGWVFPNPNTGGVWHASVLQGDILVPAGRELGIERLGWHTFRHSYRSMLDACGAPIGVQQKLMRHAQVSTTMKYGNAYMTEKRKAHGAVVQMVLPAQRKGKAETLEVSA